MEYIKNKDYDYIMNKYHNASQPFDGHSRFIRKDDIFSDDTGMDGDKIREEILRRDEEIKHLSHPVRKAKAFEFVLENTKISCDSRDIFPAINMIVSIIFPVFLFIFYFSSVFQFCFSKLQSYTTPNCTKQC